LKRFGNAELARGSTEHDDELDENGSPGSSETGEMMVFGASGFRDDRARERQSAEREFDWANRLCPDAASNAPFYFEDTKTKREGEERRRSRSKCTSLFRASVFV